MAAPLLNRTTLSAHLEGQIRTRLRAGRGGLRLPPEKEMAQEFAVSVPLVRRALETLEKESLVESMPGRGWKIPADAKEPCIAILYDLDITGPSTGSSHLVRIQESKRLFEAAGYRVAIYLGDHITSAQPPARLTCEQFQADLADRRFSGVLAPWAYPDPAWTKALKEAGIPLVGFGLLHENMVSYDFEGYIRLAIEAFKQRNRRRIACVGAVAEWNLGGHDRQRLELTRRLLTEAGFEVEASWVRQDWHHSIPAAGWSSFREIWTGGPTRPDGLILNTPRLWPDVKKAITSLQLAIPDDLDVILNREAVSRNSSKSTGAIELVYDTVVMVRKSVEMLLDLMEGRPVAENRCFVNAWSYTDAASLSTAPRERSLSPTTETSFA